jgi:hypothetical protein
MIYAPIVIIPLQLHRGYANSAVNYSEKSLITLHSGVKIIKQNYT